MNKYVLCLIGILGLGFTNICNASWISRRFRRYNHECIGALKNIQSQDTIFQALEWKNCVLTFFNFDINSFDDNDLKRYFKRDCHELGKEAFQEIKGKLHYLENIEYDYLVLEDWKCMKDENILNWWR